MQRLSHTTPPVRAFPALAMLAIWMLQVFALPFHLASEDHNPQQHGHAHAAAHAHAHAPGNAHQHQHGGELGATADEVALQPQCCTCEEESPHAPHSESEHRVDVLPQRGQVEIESVLAWRLPESPNEWVDLPQLLEAKREFEEPRPRDDPQRRPQAQRGPPQLLA